MRVYCIRFENYEEGLASVATFLKAVVMKHQTRAFKINYSPSFLLEDIETKDLRFFYASWFNNRILDKPYLVVTRHDFECFIQDFELLDILDFCRRQVPDSKNKIKEILSLTFYVEKLDFPLVGRLGTGEIVLPEYILNRRGLHAFNTKNGRERPNDFLCFFRCLAAFMTGSNQQLESKTKYYYYQLVSGKDISQYKGVTYEDITKYEDILQINVNIYSLAEVTVAKEDTLAARWIRRSREIYKNTLNLDQYESHFSYIFDLRKYGRIYQCSVCDELFPRQVDLKRHIATCVGGCTYSFKTGVYHPALTIWEKIEREGLPIDMATVPKFYKYRATFDIETYFTKDALPWATKAENTVYMAKHNLLSLAVASNVPGFESARFFLTEGSAVALTKKMMDYLNTISEVAYK